MSPPKPPKLPPPVPPPPSLGDPAVYNIGKFLTLQQKKGGFNTTIKAGRGYAMSGEKPTVGSITAGT